MVDKEQWQCEINNRIVEGPNGALETLSADHVIGLNGWHGPKGEPPFTDKMGREQQPELTDPDDDDPYDYYVMMDEAEGDLASDIMHSDVS